MLCRDLEEIFEFVVLVYFCFGFEVVEQRHGGFFQFVVFVFDIVEHDLFLTLGSGTSSAHSKNLRPLLNTNIPLISGKYGLRNHF